MTLFFVTSTLNNLALAYSVSIPVYIIFRSGGTFVTMIMGWLLVGKRYTSRQIAAVAVLTAGVVLATWSNAHNQVSVLLYVCVLTRNVPMPNNSTLVLSFYLRHKFYHRLWEYILNRPTHDMDLIGAKDFSIPYSVPPSS